MHWLFSHVAHFINFWQKAIYIYVSKVDSSFFEFILVIPVHIFTKVIYIIVKLVFGKTIIMKRKLVKEIFILNSMHWRRLRFIFQERISEIKNKNKQEQAKLRITKTRTCLNESLIKQIIFVTTQFSQVIP